MNLIRMFDAGRFRFCFRFALAAIAFGVVLAEQARSQPQFSGVTRLTNGEVRVQGSLPSNVNYRIEFAPALTGLTNATGWNAIVTLPPGPASLQYTDTAAPYFQQRFYRAQELAGTNALTGDHIQTTNGDVVIHPISHASIVLTWNGVTIYNDPTGTVARYSPYPKANLILVSHTHGDHYQTGTLDAVRMAGTVILAPQAAYNGMTALQKSVTTVMTNGSSTSVFGIDVQAIPAYNANHALGAGNGYVVTLGGRRFLFTGDTGNISEIRALTNIHAAFVCMNVPFTMDVTNAAVMVRAFRPDIVFPYHFRNSDATYADLLEFKRRVGQDLGIEVRARKWY